MVFAVVTGTRICTKSVAKMAFSTTRWCVMRAADQLTGLATKAGFPADVPASIINDIVAAFATPQVRALGTKIKVTHPAYGRTFQVGAPFSLSVTPTTKPTAPPLLGEQTDEILRELGYDEAAVDRLRAGGVV